MPNEVSDEDKEKELDSVLASVKKQCTLSDHSLKVPATVPPQQTCNETADVGDERLAGPLIVFSTLDPRYRRL